MVWIHKDLETLRTLACYVEVKAHRSRIYLELLRLMVSRVHRIVPRARIGDELSAIDLYGVEGERIVRVLNKGAMLPLHCTFGTFRIRC